MEHLLSSACRAIATLGYDLSEFGSLQQFAEMVEAVKLSEASEATSGPALFAALAVEIYSDDMLDYVEPPEPILAAATAVEMEAEGAKWGRFVKKRQLIDKIAEVLELMIVDLQEKEPRYDP